MAGRISALLLSLFIAVNYSGAATITVSKDGLGDYSVLQDALNAASDGDSILVGPGEYTEMSWVRLPGWGWDIQTCGYVTAHDITIIGAGAGVTVVGPPTYVGTSSTFSPKTIVQTNYSTLTLRGLTSRNSYDGVYVIGTLEMDECSVIDNNIGVLWFASGSGGWVRNTEFRSDLPRSPIGLLVQAHGGGASIIMENCQSSGVETIVAGIDGMTIRDSEFRDVIVGISINDNARVFMDNCIMSDIGRVGVHFALGSDSYCEILNSEISGGWSALDTGGNATAGRFFVVGSRLEGGSVAVLNARYRPGPCRIVGSDLLKGAGPVVQCGPSYVSVTHDLTGNYWGTNIEAEIQAWIVDGSDDPNIPATVLYNPFVGKPVSVEELSWGSVKSMFR